MPWHSGAECSMSECVKKHVSAASGSTRGPLSPQGGEFAAITGQSYRFLIRKRLGLGFNTTCQHLLFAFKQTLSINNEPNHPLLGAGGRVRLYSAPVS
jgi:hypothetical protein